VSLPKKRGRPLALKFLKGGLNGVKPQNCAYFNQNSLINEKYH